MQKYLTMNLDKWNSDRRQYWDNVARKAQHPEEFSNGFECPECKSDLYDTGQMLYLSPPVQRVRCMNCSFKGERYD
jgi:Zn ribbon nucleic-acid-binding protein